MKIAVDAMGGDNSPSEVIKGAVNFLNSNKNKNYKIVLVGNSNIIKDELKKYQANDNIEVVNANEVVLDSDQPTVAIKEKKDSSMVVGIKLLKNGEADAFVSAGNTGALLTCSTLLAGRIRGIERPVLGAMLPAKEGNGCYFLLDVGANLDPKPTYLKQYAQMATVYLEIIYNIKSPTVGLLNIGAEKEKGNIITREAFDLLVNSNVNFVGNVEARDLTKPAADIVVCDAFVGNTILKYTEGIGQNFLPIIKDELLSGFSSTIGAILCRKKLHSIRNRFADFSDIHGTPFLGLKQVVVKAHGNSTALEFESAINQATIIFEQNISAKIAKLISEDNENKNENNAEK